MSLAAINATKIARQVQLCQTFVCRESDARKALFHKRTSVQCSWLTTKSTLWQTTNTAFYQNYLLRKRIADKTVSVLPKRSFTICVTTVDNYCKALTKPFLSSIVNVRQDFGFGKVFVSTSFGNFLEKMAKHEFQRLPESVIPKHYNLELKPDLIGFTFNGKTSIKIQVSGKYHLCTSRWMYANSSQCVLSM